MNTKKISKNSEKKQTIHIDELLRDKQNYQACHDFSVDEQLQAKLSNIPYTYAQQHVQQHTQKKDYAISDNKTSWFDWLQLLFQPKYAILSVVLLIIGVSWFLGKQRLYDGYTIKTPGSNKEIASDPGVNLEAITEDKDSKHIMMYAMNASENENLEDIQPVMLKWETCDDKQTPHPNPLLQGEGTEWEYLSPANKVSEQGERGREWGENREIKPVMMKWETYDECEDYRFCLVDISKEEILFEKIPLSWNTEKDIATAFGMQAYLSTVKDNTNGCCENGRNCLANNRGYWMLIPKYGIKIFSSSFTKDTIKKENFVDDYSVELHPRSKGDSYTPSLSIHRILTGERFEDAIIRSWPEWKYWESSLSWDPIQEQWEKREPRKLTGVYQPVLMELDQDLVRTYSGARLAKDPTPLTGFNTKIRKPWYVRFWYNINTADPDSFKIFQYGDMLIFHLKSHPDVFFSMYHHYVKPQSPTCPEFLFDSIE